MKLQWQVVAALSILPFGAALADYADLPKPAAPPSSVERSAEHEALIDIAEQGLERATHGAHELAIALQNARRNHDMVLVTCLLDALENVRAVQADAIANLGRMSATKAVAQARVVASSVGDTSKELNAALENAARCATSEGSAEGETVVTVEMAEDGTLDPGATGGVGFTGVSAPTPVNMPPTVDVMEPGTDMPLVPPTASPMR